jgi:hypothetical protein
MNDHDRVRQAQLSFLEQHIQLEALPVLTAKDLNIRRQLGAGKFGRVRGHWRQLCRVNGPTTGHVLSSQPPAPDCPTATNARNILSSTYNVVSSV